MFAKDFAICVVEDVSIRLNILTLDFFAMWEHPPSFCECMLILRQLLVRHNLAILQ